MKLTTYESLPAAGLAYLLARERSSERIVVVVVDEERGEALVRDLRALGRHDAVLFPGDSHVPFEDVSLDPRITATRLAVRASLGESPPGIVVASAAAVQGRWMDRDAFRETFQHLTVGEDTDREELARGLVRAGFQRVSLVEDEGTFAVRGGIVDVFLPGGARPLRIDLFGDEVASIKTFNPDTQRTFDPVDRLSIFPIRDVVFTDERIARALGVLETMAEKVAIPSRQLRAMTDDIEQRNYFFGIETLWPVFYAHSDPVLDELVAGARVVLEEPDALTARFEARFRKAEAERIAALERGNLAVDVAAHMLDAEECDERLAARTQVRVVSLADDCDESVARPEFEGFEGLAKEMKARREDASRGEILDPIVAEIRRAQAKSYELFLCCQSRGQGERLRELLRARSVDLPLLEALPPVASMKKSRSARYAIAVAPLGHGIQDREAGVVLLTDVELLGHAPKSVAKGRRKKAPSDGLNTLRDLKVGDIVVHVDHGLGRYEGLRRLILNGVDGDYVHLEYADGDKLYLPVYRLNVLQRYQGNAETAKLDKLGGTRWERAKQRVKDAVLNLAHELLAVQAKRKMRPGFKFEPPDELYRSFEARFPFEETPDQQKAIDDVLADLTAGSPMDRLVVGDVGFGKTEVALRAACLAAVNGRQVAILVPTTVLAEQHGIRFKERFEGFPVRVEVLSRFRSAKEAREITQRVREGAVDILIGTHRMLSADVGFKDLGLLIVDEEQRFGVRQKERVKQLRANVHVLALSATPIPRTLHMATVGLRDLSIIQTPPAERTGIRTEVTRFSEELIGEAVRRELTRGGQVFVVHNRISSIDPLADLVRTLVPEARVVVAHGKMTGEKLEKIMVDFVRREFNVLVCTAIIESGIDIPTVNTMIVDRADQFGLSQLYQLRGRIGRGRDRAFAYLLLPRGERIQKEAAERLQILKRFSDLGSGFQIASQDLELRGAGDLLGANQSGHIAAVGYELYTELLAEAVERARGQREHTDVEPEIKLPVSAVIPEKYLPDPMLRLEFYQRMATAPSDEAVFDVVGEIEERYGAAPDEVELLAEVMVIRRRLKNLGAVSLSAVNGETIKMSMTFVAEPPLDLADLARRAQREPNRYKLLPSGKLGVFVNEGRELPDRDFLRSVRHEIGQLKTAPSRPTSG